MGLYRAPTVALMPDVTPAPLRSQANGIINFMGGFGALIAFFVAAPLFRTNERLPFVVGALLVMVSVIALRAGIRETRLLNERQTHQAAPFATAVRSVFAPGRRGTMYLLLAIFAWFIGYQGVEAFFTLYAVNVLGVDAAAGAFTLGFFALAFLLFSIPAGFLAVRFGRRRTIRTGLATLIVVFLAGYTARSVAVLQGLFLLGGLGWAMINVNSYPMVVEMAGSSEIGTYTGLYYFFSSGAAIAGPPLIGLLRDLFGYRQLFLYAAVPIAVALFLMGRVRGGEPTLTANPAAGLAGPHEDRPDA